MKTGKSIKLFLRLLLVMTVLATVFGVASIPVQAQPTTTASIDQIRIPGPPNTVINDGTDTELFWWKITGLADSTPVIMKHSIKGPGISGPEIAGHTEITDIRGFTLPIFNVENTVGDAMHGNDSFLEYAHAWDVPAGQAPGTYYSRVEYYSQEISGDPPGEAFDSASEVSFIVEQPWLIFKYDDINGNGQQDLPEEQGLDGWNFTVTGPGTPPYSFTGTTSGGGFLVLPNARAVGDYTVTETLKGGWINTDPGSITQVITIPGELDPANPVVIFGNQGLGTLEIIKNTTGGNATFTYTVSGGPTAVDPQSITTVGGTGTAVVHNLIPGNYTVTEGTLPPGWTADGLIEQTVAVPSGSVGTVTFANTARGSLKITKNTTGGDGEFTYTVSDGPSTVDQQTVITTGGTGSVTVPDLIAGTYTVTENTLPGGWTADGPMVRTVVVPINGIGEATFDNTARGNLQIIKNTTGGNGSFTFTATGPSAVPQQTINTIAGTGNALVAGLIAGEYIVTEGTLPPGWTANGLTQQTVTVPINGTGTVTFSNTARGNLEITKITHGGNGTFTFTATGPDTVPQQTIVTVGGTGSETVLGLIAGQYTVTEGSLPSGWISNGLTEKTVTVPINGTGEVEFENTAQGNLQIIKNTIGGDGTFTFTAVGPSTVAPQTINTVSHTGSVQVNNLTAGLYTVTEGTLPDGWEATSLTVQTVTVPIGGTGTVTFSNTAYGDLQIIKTTTGGDGTFGYAVSGPSTVDHQSVTTSGGAGQVTVPHLIAGNYTVNEDVIPPGWTPNGDTVKTVTVPINGTGTATFSNTGKGSLQIIKTTTGGDGTFTYTATGPDTVAPQTITTSGNSGSVTVPNLIAGTYTVTEGTLPAGWTADGLTVQTVTVPVNGTGTVTFANTAHGSLKITKNTIGGDGTFDYSVTGGPSTVPNQHITTSGGTNFVTISGLIAGTYTVNELALPPGWEANGDTSAIVVVPINGTGEAIFTNTAYGSLEIIKNTTGGNGTFGYAVTGGLSTVPHQEVITSGGTGSVTVLHLIAGQYTVTEDVIPPGWTPDGDTVKTVTVPINGVGTATFANTGKGNLQIVKNTTGGDSSFTYTATGPDTVAPQTVTTSGNTGSVTVTDLVAGVYTVTEGALPAGWTADGSMVKTVTVPVNGTGTVTFDNTAHGSLRIIKNTIGGNGTFGYSVGGGLSTVPHQNVTTIAGTGQVTIDNLIAGNYIVTEDALPPGWSSNGDMVIQVTVPVNGIGTATFSNTGKGNLQIIKNTIGGNGTFTYTAAGPSTVPGQSITTSAGTGSATVSELIAGEYIVTEGALPPGWSANGSTQQTVTVPINGTGTATFSNTAYGNLKIIKNTTGGDGTFSYSVSGGLSIVPNQSITTSGGTNSVTVTGLIAGTYSVNELTLPPGWTADGLTTQSVVVPINGTGEVTFENTAHGSLRIIKNTTGGNGTFTFTATGPSAVPQQTIITSGGTGQVTVSNLEAGDYVVTEGSLPGGWQSSSATTVNVTVPINGIGTATFSNTAYGSLRIIKNTIGGNGTFTFTATGPSAVPAQTVVTAGGTGQVTVNNLVAGTYSVVEGTLPGGWSANGATTQSVVVPINSIGTATFENTAYGNLEIIKNTTGGNATFTYAVSDGLSIVPNQSITTVSGTGNKIVSHIIAGEYTVTENALPPGWTNDDPMVRTVTVPVNGTGTVAFANTGHGTLRIIKNTFGGDATFTFSTSGPSTVAVQSITTAFGTGQVDIPVIAGHYTVGENALPTDWIPTGDTVQEVDVPVNGIGTVIFENIGRGQILITKYHDKNKNGSRDPGEEGLPDWKFTVSGLPDVYQTDLIGRAFVEANAGDYTVTEVDIDPAWSNTDPGGATPEKSVTVTTSHTVEVLFGNYMPGELIIEKRDIKSGKIIDSPGVTFTVEPDPFTGVGILEVKDNDINDSNPDYGIIDLKDIIMGIYVVTEIVAPTGYKVDPMPNTANVSLLTPVVTVRSEDTPIRVPGASTLGMGFMIAGLAGFMIILMRRRARQS